MDALEAMVCQRGSREAAELRFSGARGAGVGKHVAKK